MINQLSISHRGGRWLGRCRDAAVDSIIRLKNWNACFQLPAWTTPQEASAAPGRPMPGWRFDQMISGGPEGSAGQRGWAGSAYHIPIMAKEVVHFLQPGPDKWIFEGTLGGGGHTELLLNEGAEVLSTDRDPAAILRARERLEPQFGQKFWAVRGNFDSINEILHGAGISRKFDGAFLDLGLSSRQLEDPAKGFSFMREGRLDMRMDPDASLTAEAVVNEWSEQDLLRILREYAEEPAANRVVRTILRERARHPIRTTLELAELVASVVPKKGRAHPATRTFQGIRLAVNDELGSLERVLALLPGILAPGARVAVLTFNSLEDRIVKTFFKQHSMPTIDKIEWPAPRKNPDYHFDLILKKPVSPSEEEVAANPRSRSCKLRVAERIGHRPHPSFQAKPHDPNP